MSPGKGDPHVQAAGWLASGRQLSPAAAPDAVGIVPCLRMLRAMRYAAQAATPIRGEGVETMHVVLVGPELEENLSLRYLRGALEAVGHRVTQADFDGPEDQERMAAAIAASGADLAGLSMVFTRRARQFAELATRCRELGYRGRVVAGGHFAAFHAERLLQDVPAIDAVVIGEGERILCELASSPSDLASVAGLV